MGRLSDYKKRSELTSWDLDKGCRTIVNQSRATMRKLKQRIRRQDRKRIKESVEND